MFKNCFIFSALLLTGSPILAANPRLDVASPKVIEGDFFIIPGASTTKENFERWNLSQLASEAMEALNGYDQLPTETQLVRVWMTNGPDENSPDFDSGKHSANWSDHGHPQLPRDSDPDMAKYARRAPQHLSIDALRGLQEGDSFTTTIYGALVTLTARQLGYKYKSKPFEAMLVAEEKLFKEFKQKEAEDERRKQAQRQQQEMLRSEGAIVASSLKPAFNQRRNQANLPESFLQKMFHGPIQ